MWNVPGVHVTVIEVREHIVPPVPLAKADDFPSASPLSFREQRFDQGLYGNQLINGIGHNTVCS